MGRITAFFLQDVLQLTSTDVILSFAAQRYQSLIMAKDIVKGHSLTYGLFWKHAVVIANFITTLNLPEDVSIGYCGQNDINYFIVRTACSIIKRPFVAISNCYDTNTMAFLLNQTQCKLLFYNTNIDTSTINRVTPYLIETGSSEFQEILCSKHLPLKKNKKSKKIFQTYNLSSATTNKLPKIIVIPDNVWVNSLYNYINFFNGKSQPGQKFLCLPPFTGAGSVPFLPITLSGGCQIIFFPKTPQALLNTIKSENIDFVYLTPAYFTRLITFCFKTNQKPKCKLIVGSDRLNPYALRFATKQLGIKVATSYGLAEVLPPLTYNCPTANDEIEAFASVGSPFPNVKIDILKNPKYRFKNQRIGRIKLHSNTIAKGYLNNKEATLLAFQDGFLTSDYGFIDAHNRLHILGRELEILELNGLHILSSEIETYISSLLPYILLTRVIMEKDKLAIFIEIASIAKEDIQTNKISAIITENIEKKFGVVPVIHFLEHLPTSQAGKIDIMALNNWKGISYGA